MDIESLIENYKGGEAANAAEEQAYGDKELEARSNQLLKGL